MSSIRQIEANRRNALKSTGPCSAEGKAVSRFNALKTGIDSRSAVIPGEDPSELGELAARYHAQYRPATAVRSFLVDSLANAEWQLRRLRRAEAEIWAYKMEDIEKHKKYARGIAFIRGQEVFTRLQRRIDAAERVYRRALERLERPEAAMETPAEPEADPAECVAPILSLSPEPVEIRAPRPAIGFVPPTSSTPIALPQGEQLTKCGGDTCARHGLEREQPSAARHRGPESRRLHAEACAMGAFYVVGSFEPIPRAFDLPV